MNDPNQIRRLKLSFLSRVRRECRIRIDHRYLYEGGLMNDYVMMTECDGGTGREENILLTLKLATQKCIQFKVLFMTSKP